MKTAKCMGVALLILAPALFGTACAAVLAHYSFDTNYTDVSGNGAGGTLVDTGTAGNSGVTTNAGEWVFGGGALHLDAERDYVSVTSRTFNSGTHAYSIAFWAKRAGGDTGGAAQWDMVIGQRDTTNHYIALGDPGSTNALHWRGSDATAARNHDFACVNDTNWHHHVIAADTAQNIACYLDGALVSVATAKLTGFIVNTIGEAYTSPGDFDFNGELDEIWIFNERITAAVVSNLYLLNEVSASSTDIVAVLHYSFETNFTDSSSASNHGTASGGAVITNGSPQIPVGNGALAQDGADASYVALSSPIVFSSSQPWTVAFWAQRGELGGQKGMVIGERFTIDDFIWLNDSFTGLRFRNSAGQNYEFTVSKNTNLHHYALVATGDNNLTLYVDGAYSQSVFSNGTSFTINSVGQAYTTTSLHYAFSGLLDDVRVYSGALGGVAIQALYQMKTATNSTNVVVNVVTNVTRLRVILQGGQSNSDGRGEPAGLPVGLQSPQTNIDFYYREGTVNTLTTLRAGTSFYGQFGPEVTCGPGYAAYVVTDSSTRVAIIKYARGGTSLITDWKPGGDATTAGDGADYVIFQQTVSNGMAALRAIYTNAVITIDGMTWMQGESDNSVASTYETNLTAFIADVRATIQTNLPFIIARLSSNQTAVGGGLATLRAAQVSVAAADAWSGIVDTDPFAVKTDFLHFDATGQVALGYAFAYQLYLHQDLTNRFSPAQIAGGNAEPSADADNDGASNEAEFLAGTDATNSASVLRAQISSGGGGLFNVGYPTAPGRSYAVESQPDIAVTNWSLALPPEAGTGTNANRAVTNNAGTGFIRIRATLP